jgi:hypothetical protein
MLHTWPPTVYATHGDDPLLLPSHHRTKDGQLVVLHIRELQQLLGPKAKQRPGLQVGIEVPAALAGPPV